MSKTDDPRAIRTKKMLKEAVIQLLEEGIPREKLTIQKVTSKAQLNRTTYYLHYKDITDLLDSLTLELVEELSAQIRSLRTTKDQRVQLLQLLDYLYDQRKYILLLFQKNEFETLLFDQFHKLILIRREDAEKKREGLVASDIRTASLIGIVMWWLKHGLRYSSEHIATEIIKMHHRSPLEKK
ncbi:TetR/AcrR family transcriptional regulator [Kurthia senegalensis]|uniref:TetR/AcrR family transcriptional regulator n=1 Tax=Kurthia senegalensis TaxID=1033740 RepID=UPI000288BFC9|nr:TetR-like C-terminal domain-containing protein [Kurthia senegalensis]